MWPLFAFLFLVYLLVLYYTVLGEGEGNVGEWREVNVGEWREGWGWVVEVSSSYDTHVSSSSYDTLAFVEGGLGLGGEGDLCVLCVGVDAASRVYTLKTSVCGSVCVCVCVCMWMGVGGWVWVGGCAPKVSMFKMIWVSPPSFSVCV